MNLQGLKSRIWKVVNDNWGSLGSVQREPYEDNYDGFTHYTKSGLVAGIIDALYDDGMEHTTSNIENLFFDMV